MQRVVALKVFARERGRTTVVRCRREAEAAAALHHPYLVTAHDAGVSRGRRFLVMEYLPGLDLGRRVAHSGPLDAATVVIVLRQVAEALHYLHERGLIHGDVTPANLHLGEAAGVKLLDLGLVRRSGEESHDSAGTPGFLAPELAAGRSADIRSDLYSLGRTAAFLLTGVLPSEIAPDLAGSFPELAVLLARLTEADSANRFATPAELLMALDALRLDPIPTRAANPAAAIYSASSANCCVPWGWP